MFRSQAPRVFKRTVIDTGIKKPSGVNITNQASDVNPPLRTASLTNGTKGTPLFPKGTVFPIVNKQIRKLSGWFLSLGAIMIFWPLFAVHSSNIVRGVPAQAPEVVLDGNHAQVNAPITPAHLDKPSDDDE